MEDLERYEDQVALQGVVVADDYNDDEEVVSVAIETDNGDEYLVTWRGVGHELVHHLNRYVSVVGYVRKGRYGDLSIDVTDYELVSFD